MKTKITVIFLFFAVWATAQTTVRFAETHQFFDPSEKVLTVKLLLQDPEAYTSPTPIVLEIFSDLKVSGALEVTATRSIDKIIRPEHHTGTEQIEFPVNAAALKDLEKFTLYIRKKDKNENFIISQDSHVVILSKPDIRHSWIGITAAAGIRRREGTATRKTIEIPFRLETKGYIPVAADSVVARLRIRGIEGSDSLAVFPVAGAGSTYTLPVEKQKTPGIYRKLIEMLDAKVLPELEISEIVHPTQHQINIDPSKRSVQIQVKKMGLVDASYSFHLGTNFDFSTNFEAKDIYYELDISLFNLLKRLGLRAGMYRSSTSRYLEDFMLKSPHYELIGQTGEGQIYNLIETGMAPGIATESLGFYFEIPYKVLGTEYFDLFVAPHLELIERGETYSYEIIYEEILAAMVTVYEFDFSETHLPETASSKYWESYFGLGFPMRYRNPGNDFQVMLNPVFGVGFPGPYARFWPFYTGDPEYDYVEIVEDLSGPLLFSAFQFNIIINPKETLGIKLGTDIRQYYGSERKPVVSINLSTKIEFSKLFNLTGG